MLDRRNFMKTCSGMGLAGTLFPGVLWAQAQAQGAAKITKEMIDKSLRFALFIAAQRLREANEIVKSALQLVSHGTMVMKSVATHKPHSACRAVTPYQT